MSNAAQGSSRMRILGLFTTARAIKTRACCPRLSSLKGVSAKSSKFNSVRILSTSRICSWVHVSKSPIVPKYPERMTSREVSLLLYRICSLGSILPIRFRISKRFQLLFSL
mmetsp:Transcript_23982/g.58046  ORF Transcript_23982/g.58046 Transcript_23982/m.58046 type:complete len:111 (+) Transcript_23982:391-723(+)